MPSNITNEEAIEKMKDKFPYLAILTGRFYIENGSLWYVGFDVPDMNILQDFINETLGQKVYRAEYIAYKDVYAVNEEQAAEFLDGFRPTKTITRCKIYETNEYLF